MRIQSRQAEEGRIRGNDWRGGDPGRYEEWESESKCGGGVQGRSKGGVREGQGRRKGGVGRVLSGLGKAKGGEVK